MAIVLFLFVSVELWLSCRPEFGASLGKSQKTVQRVFRLSLSVMAIAIGCLFITLILWSVKSKIWLHNDVQISEIGAVDATSVKLWFRTPNYANVVRSNLPYVSVV